MSNPAAESAAQRAADNYKAHIQAAEAAVAAFVAVPYWWRKRTARNVLQARVDATLTAAQAPVLAWINQDLPALADAGVGSLEANAARFGWDTPVTLGRTPADLVDLAQQQAYDDLLHATNHASESLKSTLRGAAKDATARIIDGDPATTVASDTYIGLEDSGLLTVTYANGADVSVASYIEMATRTLSASIYNQGVFAASKEAGWGMQLCSDSPDCGMSSHDDPEKPDGQPYPLDVAEDNDLSHPNCVRAWTALPVDNAADAYDLLDTIAGGLVPAEQVADAGLADAELADTGLAGYGQEQDTVNAIREARAGRLSVDRRAAAVARRQDVVAASTPGEDLRAARVPRTVERLPRQPRMAQSFAANATGTAWAEQPTTKAVTEEFQRIWGTTAGGATRHIDFAGMDATAANATARALHEAFQTHPVTAEQVRIIGSSKGISPVLNEIKDAYKVRLPRQSGQYADASERFQSIRVANSWSRDSERWIAQLKSDVEQGFHPPGTDSIEGMVQHEFGHHLDFQATRVSRSQAVGTPNTGQSIMTGRAYERAVDEVIDQLRKDAGRTRDLSEYATRNRRELIAEAVSEVMSSSTPRPFAKAVYDVVVRFAEGRS